MLPTELPPPRQECRWFQKSWSQEFSFNCLSQLKRWKLFMKKCCFFAAKVETQLKVISVKRSRLPSSYFQFRLLWMAEGKVAEILFHRRHFDMKIANYFNEMVIYRFYWKSDSSRTFFVLIYRNLHKVRFIKNCASLLESGGKPVWNTYC